MFFFGGFGFIGNTLSIFVLLKKVSRRPHPYQLLKCVKFLGEDLFQLSPGGSECIRYISHCVRSP